MSEPGPIVLTGASGLVGGALLESLRNGDRRVRALVRRRSIEGSPQVREYSWNGIDAPAEILDGASAVVHLPDHCPVEVGAPLTEPLATAEDCCWPILPRPLLMALTVGRRLEIESGPEYGPGGVARPADAA